MKNVFEFDCFTFHLFQIPHEFVIKQSTELHWCLAAESPFTMAAMNKELHNFLVEAELEHYYSALKNELKISVLAHLKYVKDEDLMNVGMTKPEIRRLKKYYRKEMPQGAIGKIKKVSTHQRRALFYLSELFLVY